MKPITSVAIAALMLGLGACKPATAEKTEPSAAPAAGVVTLQAQPDLAEGVEALPRLAGDGAAITAINADLEKLDAEAKAGGCDGGGGFERGVSEPMTGPGFVTFWISEGYFCEGSAHPSNDQTAITYDLATGQRVDWVAAAPGLHLKGADTEGMPATYMPGLSSSEISAFYSRKILASTEDAEHISDCRDTYSPEALTDTFFKVWLDAEDGGVTIAPEFAHVVQACADSVTMTAEEMRGFGVSEAIIAAVTTGHAAGNWAPKEDDAA